MKPRQIDDAIRITLVVLSQLIDWRAVLMIVKPDTLLPEKQILGRHHSQPRTGHS
jgi:hypothetical protein